MDVNYYSDSCQSFQCFMKIKKLFRTLEIVLILVFLTWATARLPRIFGEYLRRLVNVVVCPLFIFLLSNALVLTLFFKSRHLFPQHDSDHAVSTEEALEGFSQELLIFNSDENLPQPEDVVFQDKETILEVMKPRVEVHRRSTSSESLERVDKCMEDNACVDCGKKKKLVRSETEKQRWRDCREEVADVVDENEMSNEEFQRAIEDFIARQVKFHREEKLAIVLRGRT